MKGWDAALSSAAEWLDRSRVWSEDVQAAVEVLAAADEHERACQLCRRTEAGLLAGVVAALSQEQDEQLADLADAAVRVGG